MADRTQVLMTGIRRVADIGPRHSGLTALRARRLVPAAIGILAVLIGCRSALPIEYQLEPVPTLASCGAPCVSAPPVAITYLGVSGFLISYRGKSILTGPLFTNPGFDSVTPSYLHFFRGKAPSIRSDPRLIERLLPEAADDASMILIGHGHYDHLLDVPYIADHRARGAKIYGSQSVRHMLMGDSALHADSSRLVAIDTARAGNRQRMGDWYYSADRAFRVMALNADHAPTVKLFGWGQLFASGTVGSNLTRLPDTAEDWKVGETFSYVIDILAAGDTTPVFRVYYQDAPHSQGLGLPPTMLGGRGFDVAILCVATADNVSPASPTEILHATHPGYVIAAHWESFFRPQTLPLELNPTSNVDGFFTRLGHGLPATSGWNMPLPRTTLIFATGR